MDNQTNSRSEQLPNNTEDQSASIKPKRLIYEPDPNKPKRLGEAVSQPSPEPPEEPNHVIPDENQEDTKQKSDEKIIEPVEKPKKQGIPILIGIVGCLILLIFFFLYRELYSDGAISSSDTPTPTVTRVQTEGSISAIVTNTSTPTPISPTETSLPSTSTPTVTPTSSETPTSTITPIPPTPTPSETPTSPSTPTATSLPPTPTTALPTPTHTPIPSLVPSGVATTGVNVHSVCHRTQNPVTQLAKGQTVTILQKSPKETWLKIKTSQGIEGWVDREYIKLSQALDSVDKAVSCESFTFNEEKIMIVGQSIKGTLRAGEPPHWYPLKTPDGTLLFWFLYGPTDIDPSQIRVTLLTHRASDTADGIGDASPQEGKPGSLFYASQNLSPNDDYYLRINNESGQRIDYCLVLRDDPIWNCL